MYYRNAEAALIIYDITNADSLREAKYTIVTISTSPCPFDVYNERMKEIPWSVDYPVFLSFAPKGHRLPCVFLICP